MSERLSFSGEPLGHREKLHFERNRKTLEFLDQLQSADEIERVAGAVMPGQQLDDEDRGNSLIAKPGFAHHESASELLRMLGSACLSTSTQVGVKLP